MRKRQTTLSALERHCVWLHALEPIEVQWEGECWPTILHAVAASRVIGRPYTETIREAPTIDVAQARVTHLIQRYPHLELAPKVRRYRMQDIVLRWYEAYLVRVTKKAAE